MLAASQLSSLVLTSGLGGLWVHPLGAQQRVLAHLHVTQGPVFLFTVHAECGSYAPGDLLSFLTSTPELLQSINVMWLGRTSLCTAHVPDRTTPTGSILQQCLAPCGIAPRAIIGLAVGGQQALLTPIVVPGGAHGDDVLRVRRLPNRASAGDALHAAGGADRVAPQHGVQLGQQQQQQQQQDTTSPPPRSPPPPQQQQQPMMPPAPQSPQQQQQQQQLASLTTPLPRPRPQQQQQAPLFSTPSLSQRLPQQQRQQLASGQPPSPRPDPTAQPSPQSLLSNPRMDGTSILPLIRTSVVLAAGDNTPRRKLQRWSPQDVRRDGDDFMEPGSPAHSIGSSLRLEEPGAVPAPGSVSDGDYGGGYDSAAGEQHDDYLSAQLNVRSMAGQRTNAAPLALTWVCGGRAE